MASGSDSRWHDPNGETKNDLPPPPSPPPPPPPSSPPPPTPPPPSSPPPPTPPPPSSPPPTPPPPSLPPPLTPPPPSSSPPPPTPPPPSSPPPPPPPPPFQRPSTYPIIRGVMTELQDEGFIMKAIIGTKLYEGRMGKNTNQPLKNILNPHPLPHIPQKYPYITAILNGKFANGFFARALFLSAVYVGQLFLAPGQEVFNQIEAKPNDQKPSVKARKRTAKKKDPNYPKRVRNGYNYFFAKQQVLLRSKHPETDHREVSRMIGAMWTNMSEADKEMYKEQGRQDKVRYLREMEEYNKRPRENQVPNDAGPSSQSASGSGYATESPLAQGIHIAGPSTQPASGSRSATAEGALAEVKGGGHACSDLEAGPSSKAPVGEPMCLPGSSSNN